MSRHHWNILLIGDNDSYSQQIHHLLQQIATMQVNLSRVETVSAALAHLSAGPADAVLILWPPPPNAPAYTGIDQLSHQFPRLPILVIASHNDDDEIACQTMQHGAQDYLLKQEITPTLLQRAILLACNRQAAKLGLLESEERYRTLFEESRDIAYIADSDNRFIAVNQPALDFFGYTHSEMIGLLLQNLFVTPEDYQLFQQTLQSAGFSRDYEVKLLKKDQTQTDCLLTSTVRRSHEQMQGYQGLIRDITERKALEEMWRRYEFIVNTSREFMTLVSRNYTYEAANESYCHAHNKPRTDIVGRTVAEVWGESRYPTIKQPLDQCFTGHEVRFQGWLGFSALGRRYMDVTYYPYYNSEGQVTHSVVVSRDVTDRKQAEEALRYAHSQNEQLLVSIPTILIGVSPDDVITHWNKPAETAFGIPADAVIGHPFLGCGINWDWFEILTRIGNSRHDTSAIHLNDVKYTRPDGKEGFLNITVTHFGGHPESQAGFLLAGEDVTERKILESQLTQAQKLESIGQLAAGIAHEINTPTQYVGDNIRFLQESFADIADLLTQYQTMLEQGKTGTILPDTIETVEAAIKDADLDFLLEEIPTAIEQSLQGIDHVSGIVRAMKEFSHPGVDEKTTIDINKAIESTITVARNEWKYVAEVKTNLDHDMPPVPCFPGEFNQAILNIIINAAHAIGDVVQKNGDTKGTITIKTYRTGNWAEIDITDTGTGIPEAVRPRVFDPFFTTKQVGKGTGQGLAICHSVIVEKHHGMINFDTEVGKGTTFHIRLPLDSVAANGSFQ